MPVYDKFYIGAPKDPYTGQVTRYKPFLITSAAFQTLRNMYVFREVIRKRPGAYVMDTSQDEADQQLFTRLRINLGGQTGADTWSYTVPGSIFAIGQMFSIGSYCYTVTATGAPGMMITTSGTASTATYNTATGAVVIVDTDPAIAGEDLYFYPALPVMSLATYELPSGLNAEATFAFDKQFAYTYTAGSGWNRSSAGGAASVWSGSDNDYFYWTNWIGAVEYITVFFVTNNVAADAMRYFSSATNTWNAYGSAATTRLNTAGTQYIVTCRLLEVFNGRLLLFNTTEYDGATNRTYHSRIRWSSYYQFVAPLTNNEWLVASGSGFLDLPTKEAITSIAKIKDVLLVYCERSVFRLTPTGNGLNPFMYEELNSEVGLESLNSPIEFDRMVLGYGESGINGSNGQDVQRVDEAIPQTIFDVNNDNSGPERVQGIRDFFNEYAYWTYPSRDEQTTYNVIWPNRVLMYDYLKSSWSYMDDSISALGYFWQQSSVDSRQLNFQSVICGNQQGWTFRVRDDVSRNSKSLQITNISFVTTTVTITSIAHNLKNSSYVYIANVVSDNGALETQLNGKIFQVTTTGVNTFTVTVTAEPTGDTYQGCGTIERVSEIEIYTKEYNFYGEESKQIAFMQSNFYVDATTAGEVTVDFIPSASSLSLLTDAQATGAIFGTNILTTAPLTLAATEQYQTRYWHPITFACSGEYIQLHLYQSAAQLTDPDIVFEDFQINGMIFFTTRVQEFA